MVAAGVNLLGCIFFGVSAVAGYVVPSTGSMLDLAAANWNTSLGAACFLACALDTLHTDRASKMTLGRRLRELERKLEADVPVGDRAPPARLRPGRRSASVPATEVKTEGGTPWNGFLGLRGSGTSRPRDVS